MIWHTFKLAFHGITINYIVLDSETFYFCLFTLRGLAIEISYLSKVQLVLSQICNYRLLNLRFYLY